MGIDRLIPKFKWKEKKNQRIAREVLERKVGWEGMSLTNSWDALRRDSWD